MKTRITEDAFLEERIGQAVAIYLINGIRLVGVLDDHDCHVVFLRPQGGRTHELQMISKEAISTVASAP